MKKGLFIMLVLLASLNISAQERKYSTFYEQRATLFEELPTTSKDIIFLGDGLHLLGKGYMKWVEIVKPYITEK